MLKYIGKIHVDEGIWCGVKLDGPSGKHDGKVDGVRYFRCPHRYGLFAPLHHVEKILADPSNARHSILSIDSNSQNRNSPPQDSNLSEFSMSSDSTDPFHPRSPKIIRQKSLTTDLTPMETSLSSQVAQLLERIREKDSLIRQLEQQTEKNRLEDFHTTEKINELEKHTAQLQHKYDTTENENLNLIKEQFELKQRLDDLQNESTIPDDYSLLSSNEIQFYEKMKEKVCQLELTNQNLLQELTQLKDNQLIEQIESFKLQITDLQNRGKDFIIKSKHFFFSISLFFLEQFIKTQLSEKETFYQQQIKEYQTKIDQMTNEEAKVSLN
jgi:CAP-Gly domain-containing linker protein 2